ncbi:MAG TPA: ATP-dependent helicase [Ignavibacteriales bacterium]|nr:ATP-dependent helicase [Ignavibacteriales bacterium]HOL81143.1 ATP-dependent helicase [Ignavibacteriales bacterium]HOM65246.1 ATP-dependent helicase [Ignavibacteriales bacterium]HPD66538.1 ATP-dependent helicase [Ignavibacteriales bacterium]HPP33501.1 ATP-dependent helicase [Ignavibacteriales bacterium]
MDDFLKIEQNQNSKIDYQKELNSSQYQAVTSIDGTYLVIAGAGSGKTRTLVYRLAYLIEKGYNPYSIILLTFTRKAAEEMISRATQLVDDRCARVNGGTFHSFANLTLRKYHEIVKLPSNFTIMDQPDSEDVINLVKKEYVPKADKKFPNKSSLYSIISLSVNKEEPIYKIIEDQYPFYLEFCDDIVQIANKYQETKRQNNLLDYDDLLLYLNLFLQDNSTITQSFLNSVNFVMVDEFQDTNKIQGEIVKNLARRTNNIMVVGDDCQSIYSFRGANFKNIIEFPTLFEDCKIIYLTENYRSTPQILDVANEIIDNAIEKFPKKLQSMLDNGPKPTIVKTQNENEQSLFVVRAILALMEKGVKLNEIAVLFRSSFHSYDLEVYLQSAGIPYIKYGGLKFIEAAHIKDVLAFLKIKVNKNDRFSWLRILQLFDGVGPKSAQNLSKVLSDEKINWDAPVLNLKSSKIYLNDFIKFLSYLFTTNDDIKTVLEAIIEFYTPFFKNKYEDYQKRYKDFDIVINLATKYSRIESFLSDMSLDPPYNSMAGVEPQKNEDILNLSTIHSAKGLEWHTVFIINAVEGYFPSYQSLDKIENIEEERRLMYVATTRAKKNLFICCPQYMFSRTFGNTLVTPSRFVENIDNIILCNTVLWNKNMSFS